MTAAVLGAGRMGRQIALVFALGGWRVRLVDVKERAVADAAIGLTHNNSGMGEHVVMIYGREAT